MELYLLATAFFLSFFVAVVHQQVGDLPSSELLSLRWPGGDRVMAVAEAVRLTAPHVSCVTLDIKTYNDKVRGRGAFWLSVHSCQDAQ